MIYIGAIIIIIVQSPQNDDVSEDVPEEQSTGFEDTRASADGFTAQCKTCGWTGNYPDVVRAKKALGAHTRYCKGRKWNISPFSRPVRG
jgi:hypothetical protein